MKDRSLFWGDWWLFYKPAWPNCQQFNSLLYTCMLGSMWIWSGLSVNVFLYFQQVMGGGGGASYQTKQFSKRHYESICFFFWQVSLGGNEMKHSAIWPNVFSENCRETVIETINIFLCSCQGVEDCNLSSLLRLRNCFG